MIHVVTCFWNAANYLESCVGSIRSQSENKYMVHLVDDMSSDDSQDRCLRAIGGDQRFNLVRNERKKYKLKSMDELISETNLMDDDDIVVELDGDDHFSHRHVLRNVSRLYRSNPNLLIMNGRHVLPNGMRGWSEFVKVAEARHSGFCFSHLRTWRAGLWRRVDKRYFVDPADHSGGYFKTAVDVAYSLPMLELAGQERYMHICENMVVYNDQNPRNSDKSGSAVGGLDAQSASAVRVRFLDFGNPNFDRKKIEDYIKSVPRFSPFLEGSA